MVPGHDALHPQLRGGRHGHGAVAETVQPALKEVDGVQGAEALRGLHHGLQLRQEKAGDNGVQLVQPVPLGKHLLAQLLPVQLAVGGEDAGEAHVDGVFEFLAAIQHLVVDRVAVDDASPQLPDGLEGAAFSRAGASGDSQDDPLAVRVDDVEARGLFQPVADGQAQPAVVRALGENLLHLAAVEAPQGLENPLGLNLLVAAGAQGADHLLGKEMGVFVKADDAASRARPLRDLPGGVRGGAGDHCHRGLGGVVAVLHARRAGALVRAEGGGHGPVHVDVSDEALNVLHRQSAGAQEPGRLLRQVQHGGLHAHGAASPVDDHVDPAAHILQHVLGRGAAGTAGGVGAGGGDGHPRLPDNGQGDRVVGAADAHGVQARRSLVRDRGLAL